MSSTTTRLRRVLRRLVSRLLPRRDRHAPAGGSVVPTHLVEQAEASSRQEQWSDAITLWTQVVATPGGDGARAYRQLARAHRRAGQVGEAAAVLDRGRDRHPTDLRLAREHAQLAVTARDWPLALARWRAYAELAGSAAEPEAYRQLARAHEQIGDREAAAQVITEGARHHPTDRDLAVRHADAASRSRCWVAAVARWRRVIEIEAGSQASSYVRLFEAYDRSRNLAEAQRVLEEALERHPDDVGLVTAWAQLATAARDWTSARRRWQDVVDRFGEVAEPRAFVQLARAHQMLGDVDTAAAVLNDGERRFGQHRELLDRQAKLAMAQREWAVAAERWELLLAREPERSTPELHRDLSRAYSGQDDYTAAGDAVRRGLEVHPGAAVLRVEEIFLHIMRTDWASVDRAWSDLRRDATALTPGLYVGLARRSAASFRHDLAETFVAAGLEQHPENLDLRRQSVRNLITEQRRELAPEDWRWDRSFERARTLARSAAPEERVAAYHGLAHELAEATALDEAAALLRDGSLSCSDAHAFTDELITLAMARGAWQEAVGLLEDQDRSEPRVQRTLSRAHQAAGDLDAAWQAVSTDPADGPVELVLEATAVAVEADRHDDAELLMATLLKRWGRREVCLTPAQVRMLASTASRSRDLGALDRIRPLVERDLGGATLERDPSTVAIIGGGPSLAGVNLSPLEGLVHTLAINATATALPWVGAAITHDMNHLVERFHGFPGPVVAGVSPEFLALRPTIPGFDLRRRVITDRLSEVDGVLHSGGHTSAHTALGYAFLLRPKRIVLFGIDLNDFWGPDQYWHTATDPFNRRRYEGLERRAIFEAWERYRARKLQNAPAVFETTVPQLQRLGIEVVNASPESAVDCFPRVTPEEGIAACLEHPAT